MNPHGTTRQRLFRPQPRSQAEITRERDFALISKQIKEKPLPFFAATGKPEDCGCVARAMMAHAGVLCGIRVHVESIDKATYPESKATLRIFRMVGKATMFFDLPIGVGDNIFSDSFPVGAGDRIKAEVLGHKPESSGISGVWISWTLIANNTNASDLMKDAEIIHEGNELYNQRGIEPGPEIGLPEPAKHPLIDESQKSPGNCNGAGRDTGSAEPVDGSVPKDGPRSRVAVATDISS